LEVVQIAAATSVLELFALTRLAIVGEASLSPAAGATVDGEQTELFRTSPCAGGLRLEVILVASLAVVHERDAPTLINVVVPSLQIVVASAWREWNAAWVGSSRTTDGGFRAGAEMAPEVDWTIGDVCGRAKKLLRPEEWSLAGQYTDCQVVDTPIDRRAS